MRNIVAQDYANVDLKIIWMEPPWQSSAGHQ
jgi:hypothetical protein